MIGEVKVKDKNGNVKKVISPKMIKDEFEERQLKNVSPYSNRTRENRVIVCGWCGEKTKVFARNAKYCQPPEKDCFKLVKIERASKEQKEKRGKRNCIKCDKAFKPKNNQLYCGKPCVSPTKVKLQKQRV